MPQCFGGLHMLPSALPHILLDSPHLGDPSYSRLVTVQHLPLSANLKQPVISLSLPGYCLRLNLLNATSTAYGCMGA